MTRKEFIKCYENNMTIIENISLLYTSFNTHWSFVINLCLLSYKLVDLVRTMDKYLFTILFKLISNGDGIG